MRRIRRLSWAAATVVLPLATHAVGWAKKDQSAAIPSYVNFAFLEKAGGQEAADLGKW